MAKRVVFVLPSFASGGSERVVLTLAKALDRSRFVPEILVFDAGGPLAAECPADMAQHVLARPRLRQALLPLVRRLRRLRPHAVLSSLGYVNLALLVSRPALPLGTRLLVREANTPSQSLRNGPWPGPTALAYRLLYPTADAVLCQHRQTRFEMAERFNVAEARLHDLPNPVDVARLRAAAAVPQRLPGPGRRFVAVGRLTRQKGFDRLIDLFADAAPDDHLLILGDGPEREALAARAGERVELRGHEPDPWPWMAGADTLLLPSRWEGLANVALEALACGTPVIATPESGGIAELAEAAPEGAVTVAAWGKPFARAMRAANANPSNNLLPPHYDSNAVATQLMAILDGC
jgi:glycosyltransferase involved in cell wall biosynthesis